MSASQNMSNMVIPGPFATMIVDTYFGIDFMFITIPLKTLQDTHVLQQVITIFLLSLH